ncbi:MAG: peptidoglycan-binding protein [Pseudomonadota bacterium]
MLHHATQTPPCRLRASPPSAGLVGLVLCLALIAIAAPVSAQSLVQIARAQATLNAAGYEAGTPDGVMGPQTVDAVEAYQRAEGLAVTATLDEATLAGLAETEAANRARRQAAEANRARPPARTPVRVTTRPGERGGITRHDPASRRRHAAPAGGDAGRRLPSSTRPASEGPDQAPNGQASAPDGLPWPFPMPEIDSGPEQASQGGPVTKRPGRDGGLDGRHGTHGAPGLGDEAEERVVVLGRYALPNADDLRDLGVPSFPIPAWLTQWRLGLILIGLVLLSILCKRLARRARPSRPVRPGYRRDPDDRALDPQGSITIRAAGAHQAMAGGGPR